MKDVCPVRPEKVRYAVPSNLGKCNIRILRHSRICRTPSFWYRRPSLSPSLRFGHPWKDKGEHSIPRWNRSYNCRPVCLSVLGWWCISHNRHTRPRSRHAKPEDSWRYVPRARCAWNAWSPRAAGRWWCRGYLSCSVPWPLWWSHPYANTSGLPHSRPPRCTRCAAVWNGGYSNYICRS